MRFELTRNFGTAMIKLRGLFTVLLIAPLSLTPALARTITIEFLEAPINEANARSLDNVACRNLDRIVHLKIAVNWSADKLDRETAGYNRLVFWNDKAEYLFPAGSYAYLHGDYIIDGYFIARSGGIHQGITSVAFDKVDDAKVLLNPSVKEIKAKRSAC